MAKYIDIANDIRDKIKNQKYGEDILTIQNGIIRIKLY